MNAKKARAIRRMVERIASGKNLNTHQFVEMGVNYTMIEGKHYKVTAPLTVAADTVRGQYRALKRSIKVAYR